MVRGKHTPADHADLDAWINKELGFDPFYNDKEEVQRVVISLILEELAKKNGHDSRGRSRRNAHRTWMASGIPDYPVEK